MDVHQSQSSAKKEKENQLGNREKNKDKGKYHVVFDSCKTNRSCIVLVYSFTHRVRLAALSSFLALLLGWFCGPILHKCSPVLLIDILWLLVFPLLRAYPFTN